MCWMGINRLTVLTCPKGYQALPGGFLMTALVLRGTRQSLVDSLGRPANSSSWNVRGTGQSPVDSLGRLANSSGKECQGYQAKPGGFLRTASEFQPSEHNLTNTNQFLMG